MVAKKKCDYAVGGESNATLIFCEGKTKRKDRYCKRHREMIDKNIFSDPDFQKRTEGKLK